MIAIDFLIPAVPVAQPRHRSVVAGGHIRTYEAKRGHAIHAFKATCRIAARQAHQGPPIEGPIALKITFVLPRPGHLRWKSKPMPRKWHTTKPDSDNLQKSVKDALTGLLWFDDSQVCSIVATKVYASGGEQPHVAVSLRQLSEDCPHA